MPDYLLLSHPEQLQILRDQPTAVVSTVEECLRFESPIPRQPRRMKRDVTLRGQTLKQGDIAFQMLNAANRDPAQFADPDFFNVRRQRNLHLAFGQGPHICVGAPLARAEAVMTLATTFKRFPKIELMDPRPDWDIAKRSSRVLNQLRVRI